MCSHCHPCIASPGTILDGLVTEYVIECPERCIARHFVCGEAESMSGWCGVRVEPTNGKVETVWEEIGRRSHIEDNLETGCVVTPPDIWVKLHVGPVG
jgi:hypothetical protein